jgi:hypothetical protein
MVRPLALAAVIALAAAPAGAGIGYLFAQADASAPVCTYCHLTDGVAFAQHLTRELYLRPMQIDRASLRMEVERFDVGSEPRGFVVYVYSSAAPNAPAVLTVNIVRAGRYLQYVGASGSALETVTKSRELRESRRANAVKVLLDFGGHETDGKLRRSARAGSMEMTFTHFRPPPPLPRSTTAIFDEASGVMTMFGTPAGPG